MTTTSSPTSLKEYLKKYVNNNDDKEKKKKLKKKRAKPDYAGVLVVDENPVWQKPLKLDQEDADLSPPRQRRERYQLHALSPEAVLYSRSASSDISPPRRTRRSDPKYLEDHGASSPTSILSSRKPKYKLDDLKTADIAPSNSDLSPPRKQKKRSPIVVHRSKAGLVSHEDIKEEIHTKRTEEWLRFEEMDPSLSGRGAQAVYRDKKTGKRMSKEEFQKSQKKEEKPKEVKLEWGKGLAQKRAAEARLQEMKEEEDKPFARSRDDPDLEKRLKERARWGDPMAHLVKKKHGESVLRDLGASEKMKESGFIIPQGIPSHSWIRRGIEAAPNRYGIKPGRYWDGVDLGNGYERDLFKRMNEKKATEREAYLWSVSDM